MNIFNILNNKCLLLPLHSMRNITFTKDFYKNSMQGCTFEYKYIPYHILWVICFNERIMLLLSKIPFSAFSFEYKSCPFRIVIYLASLSLPYILCISLSRNILYCLRTYPPYIVLGKYTSQNVVNYKKHTLYKVQIIF